MCWVQNIIWYDYCYKIIDYYQIKPGKKGFSSGFGGQACERGLWEASNDWWTTKHMSPQKR